MEEFDQSKKQENQAMTEKWSKTTGIPSTENGETLPVFCREDILSVVFQSPPDFLVGTRK